ncbi:TetR/AcrR family transcriptional regulator [Gordonia bronchialis]|uniref:TetR/AcrR family transcriptional regulator n=1 Tax=Gordonia bronchialis TaxID=2054 RepID=UPI00226F3592|nr:TetR/AcrR family transcriptional regulator [Gordonia bronchialis]
MVICSIQDEGVNPLSRKPLESIIITSAALELLRDGGPRAVTVEAVAAQAGVAKTTIYRRYRDRSELLSDALSSVREPAPPPGTASLKATLSWIIDQCHHAVEDGIGAGGVAALLTSQDTQFNDQIRAMLLEHRHALTEVIRETKAAGLSRSDLDPDVALDCIVGAYLSERARAGRVAPGWQDRVRNTMYPAFVADRL